MHFQIRGRLQERGEEGEPTQTVAGPSREVEEEEGEEGEASQVEKGQSWEGRGEADPKRGPGGEEGR